MDYFKGGKEGKDGGTEKEKEGKGGKKRESLKTNKK